MAHVVDEQQERDRGGRPSLSGPTGTTSPQITFRLPPDLRAEAEAVAAQEGVTVSRLAREALERHLRERRGSE